ncbi:aminotransferase class III-fold pyridoxal phosphate-dependent enzyme [Pseudomonas sp. ICMP 561]|uniref:aminotransferase class III-fold pyridoxal phosphate-dependent enzyme n=1 Tax=Pseudomonas sp. ICMP 561 TaxID=1718918 RepID=UPI001C54E695|nr:aminotransferase class III-fold pyridoxal phosphate-dependent enzyme [Pseudomonas sp. ICMP 561]
MAPNYPQYFAKAEGSRIWDVDGNCYVDYLCGYGTNLLGYRNAEVESAAMAQMMLGDTMTGPGPAMVLAAEQLVSMISHADWAMFCKNGSDANSIAMVCARAHTGKSKILLAKGAYHGAANWNTPVMAGITKEDRANIIYFDYNDSDSLADAFKRADGDVAGVYATPFRHEVFEDQFFPTQEYAEAARTLCDEYGALLIVDEVRTGFRLGRDCYWTEKLGVSPDLSSWGKGIANGHPISALVGVESVREAAKSVFVTGSFWYSAVPMAATVQTLKMIQSSDYLERMVAAADKLRDGIAEQAARYSFGLRQTGPSQMPQMLFDNDVDLKMGIEWTSAVLEAGAYLHPFHNMFLSSAHTSADIDDTLEATEKGFMHLSKTCR